MRRQLPLLALALACLAIVGAGPVGGPTVPNTNALKAIPTTQASFVFRQGFNSPGDGGSAYYRGTNIPCTLNAGAGDNGSQVRGANGNCFVADFGSSIDVRAFGADPNAVADSTVAFQNSFNYVGNNRPGSEITCGGQAPGTTGLKYKIGTGALANSDILTATKPIKFRHCQIFPVSTTPTTNLFKIAPDANSTEGWAFTDLGIYASAHTEIWQHTFAFSDSGNSDLFIRNMEFREVLVSDSSGRTGNDIDLTASSSVAAATISAAGTGYGNTLTGTLTWAGSGCSVNPVINVTTSAGGAISILNSIVNRGTCDIPPTSGVATWTPGGGLSAGTGAAFNIAPGSTGFFFTTTFGPNINFFRCISLHNVGDSVTFIQPTVSWTGAGNCSFSISNSWTGAAEFSIIDPNLTSIGGMVLDRVYGFHVRGGVFECSGTHLTSPHGAFIDISNSIFVDFDMVQIQGGPCTGTGGTTLPAGVNIVNSQRIFATFLAGSSLLGSDTNGTRYVVDEASSSSVAISEIGGQFGGSLEPATFGSIFGTCGTGSIGAGNSIVANYRWIPKSNEVKAWYNIAFGAAGNGTCAGWVEVTTPFPAIRDQNSGDGRESALVGKQLMSGIPGAAFAVTGGSLATGGTGFGASATGIVTWSGAGCTVNPVLNVTTNGSGVITAINFVAVAGRCTAFPSATATTWAGSGGLSAGTGASFALSKGGYLQIRYGDNTYPGANNNVLETTITYNARR
jgi:hypothetical protein